MSSHAVISLLLLGIMLLPPAAIVIAWYVRGDSEPERWSLQDAMRARMAAPVEDVERPLPEPAGPPPPAPTVELPAARDEAAAAPTAELPVEQLEPLPAGGEQPPVLAAEPLPADDEPPVAEPHEDVPEPDGTAQERARLTAMPRRQLYDLARERAIVGRSRMTREQLVEALLPAPPSPRRPGRRRRRRSAARR
jgi:hypothetical protein